MILFISFCIDKLIFFSLNKISDKVLSGQNIGKLNQYILLKDSMDILVFGSSRANHHIDVGLFSLRSFNMGIDGRRLAYISTVIKLLSANKEQLVIVNIDPSDIFNEDYEGQDINPLKCKYHRIPTITKVLNESNTISPFQRFYWSIDYNQKVVSILKNFLTPKYDYLMYNGYDPILLSETQKEIRSKIFQNGHLEECESLFQINDTALKYLREMQNFCLKNNKNLLVVTTPIYGNNCPLDNSELKKVMEKLSIKYWDFTNHFEQNQSIEYWKDKTHLSKIGAELFTKELWNKVQSTYNYPSHTPESLN